MSRTPHPRCRRHRRCRSRPPPRHRDRQSRHPASSASRARRRPVRRLADAVQIRGCIHTAGAIQQFGCSLAVPAYFGAKVTFTVQVLPADTHNWSRWYRKFPCPHRQSQPFRALGQRRRADTAAAGGKGEVQRHRRPGRSDGNGSQVQPCSSISPTAFVLSSAA